MPASTYLLLPLFKKYSPLQNFALELIEMGSYNLSSNLLQNKSFLGRLLDKKVTVLYKTGIKHLCVLEHGQK